MARFGVDCRSDLGSTLQTSMSCTGIDHAEYLQHEGVGLVVALESICAHVIYSPSRSTAQHGRKALAWFHALQQQLVVL